MEQKTKITAEPGKQELFITRDFAIPVDLLFKAHVEADLVEQWMGNKVLALNSTKHGAYRFEVRDGKGNLQLSSSGVIHDVLENKKIIRTFEMENTPYPPQLEYLEFESRGEDQSRLNMQVIYKSVQDRDALLKLPFAAGINGAHNRLETLFIKK